MQLDGYERYAIYYAPEPDEPLTALGRSWLGVHEETAEPVERDGHGLDAAFVERITADPRRYALHGTLKAPFKLAPGTSPQQLAGQLARFATNRPPLRLAPLRLGRIGPYLALVPSAAIPDLDRLAALLVVGFDAFRAPLEAHDRERRLKNGLAAEERLLLEAWGYPYVFNHFRFHVTLSGALPEPDLARVEAALRMPTQPIVARPFQIASLCLFGDQGPGKSFRLLARFPFGRDPGTGT